MQTKSLSTPSGGAAEPEVLKHECIEMDRLAHQTKVFGKPVHLRYKEFKILWLLLRYQGAVVRVRDINENVYGDPFGEREQTSVCKPKEILAHFKSPAAYWRFITDQSDYQRTLDRIKHLTFE